MRLSTKAPVSSYSLTSTKTSGDAAQNRVRDYLEAQGLTLIAQNYKTPGRGGGEIDLIMREIDALGRATLVFIEVRKRNNQDFGGALASVNVTKQRRIIFAAQRFLQRYSSLPACRFDVVGVQGDAGTPQLDWLRGAFFA